MNTSTIDIKNYMHYYLGCEILYLKTWKGTLLGTEGDHIYVSVDDGGRLRKVADSKHVKPILRKLSDMTEEEMNECGNLDYDFSNDPELNKWTPESFDLLLTSNQFTWLLKRNFDLFGLIDAGLAIDKQTLKS